MLLNENLRLLLFSSNLLICFLLFAMLFMVEIGWRIGNHLSSKYGATKVDSSNTFLTAIFSLLALLIAFTFSGAFDRFDNRRELIALEVSATGTAYQYVDLLATKDQQKVRELFSDYLDSRINLYQDNQTLSEMHLEKKVAAHNAIGSQLWKAVVLIVENTAYPQKVITAQILPKVSDMFTASENQRLASKFHPPEIIWQALLILSFIGSLVAGYNMGIERKRDWLVVIVFSILMAGTIFIIFSLEYPRIGKVSLGDFEVELMILRKSF
jgi:hypothetical protein